MTAALMFCTKAYATSVQCQQPMTEFNIDIKAPALDTTFLMTVDANPYVNDNAVPFIMQQPTAEPCGKLKVLFNTIYV